MIPFARNDGTFRVTAQIPLPARAPANDTDITAFTADLINTVTGAVLLDNEPLTWHAASLTWRSAALSHSLLDGIDYVETRFDPTSTNVLIQPYTTPPRAVVDILKRQDEIETDVDNLQTDFNSFETTASNRHTEIIDDWLNDGVFGLPVLESLIDDLENRLGINTDAATDPSEASGTVFSKLRGAGADLDAINSKADTLLARIGSFLGTGIDTVHGWLRAIMRKDLAAPSDVGGAFNPATDSLEAIRDRGDVAWLTATGFPLASDYTPARAAKLDNLDSPISTRAIPGSAMTLTSGERSAVADQVWNETHADHMAPGSTGKALADAASGSAAPGEIADAIWDELRTGHNIAGSFGEAITELVTIAPAIADDVVAGILAETNQFADAVLKRDFNLVTGAAQRSVLNAMRKLINRVRMEGAKVTVYTENDLSVAYSQTVRMDCASGSKPSAVEVDTD